MKKTLLVILAVLCGLSAVAQDVKEIKKRRPKYVNLGYVYQQDMTLESMASPSPGNRVITTMQYEIGKTITTYRNTSKTM